MQIKQTLYKAEGGLLFLSMRIHAVYQTFSIHQNLYYPRLLLRENDEDSAIPAAQSDHFGYRKFF